MEYSPLPILSSTEWAMLPRYQKVFRMPDAASVACLNLPANAQRLLHCIGFALREDNTDTFGRVTLATASPFAPRATQRHLRILIDAGVFEVLDGCQWRMRGYWAANPSREMALASSAEQARRGRLGGFAKAAKIGRKKLAQSETKTVTCGEKSQPVVVDKKPLCISTESTAAVANEIHSVDIENLPPSDDPEILASRAWWAAQREAEAKAQGEAPPATPAKPRAYSVVAESTGEAVDFEAWAAAAQAKTPPAAASDQITESPKIAPQPPPARQKPPRRASGANKAAGTAYVIRAAIPQGQPAHLGDALDLLKTIGVEHTPAIEDRVISDLRLLGATCMEAGHAAHCTRKARQSRDIRDPLRYAMGILSNQIAARHARPGQRVQL